MLKKTLLLEITTEELPAKHLKHIAKSLYETTINELNYHNIQYKEILWFATPRRLAIKINLLYMFRKLKNIKKIGPPTSIALDKNKKPNKIAYLWMKRLSISINQIKIIKNKSNEWLIYEKESDVENIESLLPTIIKTILKKIKSPKTMRWNKFNFKFLRPIRNILILLDKHVIPIKFFNLQSNRLTSTHFFMKNTLLEIDNATQYPDILLKKGKVISDYEQRKNKILSSIEHLSKSINSTIKNNSQLLEEITSMVEWPIALIGKFPKKFLSLPQESVKYTIEKVQKCFTVYDKNNKLMPYFIIIANIDSKLSNEIIHGNEQVVVSRLSDAEFFYKIDRKKSLKSYFKNLKKIIFYNKLGSVYEKVKRLKLLMQWIFSYIKLNTSDAIRAVYLSKCDLTTNMVLEFPDIQGCIGMHYALSDGEKKHVAIAIKEHYNPKFSGDVLPSHAISYSLAIIDKLDTIVGMFIEGLNPKRNNDPFALRRLALGILRILIEKKININLKDIINYNILLYKKDSLKNLSDNIIRFFLHRIHYFYSNQGYHTQIVQSITSLQLTTPIDIHKRIIAVSYFTHSKKICIIISINKRISNILNKSNKNCLKNLKNSNTFIQKKLLNNKFEIILYKEYLKLKCLLKNFIFRRSYNSALYSIIKLCKIINHFFLNVTINKFNDQIRHNRLLLLFKIQKLFLSISNFSLL